MPALNFSARFADMVASGAKRQTIRRVRKRPIKPGDRLYLYTGLRTKACRLLGEAVCVCVQPIRVPDGKVSRKHKDAMDLFARLDGFRNWPEMQEWFRARYGLPFDGDLIRWGEIQREENESTEGDDHANPRG